MGVVNRVWLGSIQPARPTYLLAHVQRINSTFNLVDVVQSDLSSISYTITSGGKTIVASTSLTISSVIFNTLQTGTAWTVDQVGFNLAYELPSTSFPNANTVYLVEVTLTLTSGDTIELQAQANTGPA